MQESEILKRVEEMAFSQPGVFEVTESANLRQLQRFKKSNGFDDLTYVYESPRLI